VTTSASHTRPTITVIVPTYNRSKILARTLPRYYDASVSSIIVIDDGSSDDTAEVIASLQQDDRRIQFLRNDCNQGSVVSRNRGLQSVRTPYFLMTDDDTYPDSDFFPTLLATMAARDPDIIAVRKLRLKELCNEQVARRSGRRGPPVNYDRLAFEFDANWTGHTTTVDGTYFAKQALAAEAQYDPNYRGSAWREETDFGLTAYLRGFTIYFEPKAIVFELPKTDHRGGQWELPLSVYVASAIRNNWYFLNKFEEPLKQRDLLHTAIWRLQLRFIFDRLMMLLIVRAKQLLGPRVVTLGRKVLGRAS